MTKKILISGAGRIAYRHLQGLSKSKYKIIIYIHDLYLDQLKIFSHLCVSLPHNNFIIKTYNDLDQIISKNSIFDMIIVSSTANKRHILLEELFLKLKSNFWLIEKPLTQSIQGLHEILDVSSKHKNIYVNYFRRVVPWHLEIKDLMSKSKNLEVFVQSPDLGIACNTSHFVDLVMFWTSQYPTSIDTGQLEKKWIASKRKGFFEIKGEMVIKFNDGAVLHLKSDKDVNEALIYGKDLDTGKSFKIDETNNVANIFGDKPLYGNLCLQSELTGKLFDDFILENKCNLTRLDEAAKGYAIIIEALVEHWKISFKNFDIIEIPIT